MLYVVMESDLCTLSAMNVLVKYADDTNLLVPSDSDLAVILIDRFSGYTTSSITSNSGPWRIEWLSIFSRPNKLFLGALIPDWMAVRLHWWVWSKLSLPNCWALL